jgi:hypothetical protein
MPDIQPLPARQPKPAAPARQSSRKSRRPPPPRSGDLCPNCQAGRLDYDGLLNLSCQACGYVADGSGGGCS